MAVVLMATGLHWVGLSTDSKPTAPPAGSSFYETNTRQFYVYDGSAWQLEVRP